MSIPLHFQTTVFIIPGFPTVRCQETSLFWAIHSRNCMIK